MVAPDTANLIGKAAAGSAMICSPHPVGGTKPVLLCPAMNVEMWRNPAVQENLARLKGRGLQVMEPQPGNWPAAPWGWAACPSRN